MDEQGDAGEDPTRVGNTGRGLTVLALVLFVAAWVLAAVAGLGDGDEIGATDASRLRDTVTLGMLGTIAAAMIGLVGVAMRALAAWLEVRTPRDRAG
jgi:hypothetical protein